MLFINRYVELVDIRQGNSTYLNHLGSPGKQIADDLGFFSELRKMQIEKMTYKDISDAVGEKVALGFKMRNNKLIVRMENVKQEENEKEIYKGIKTI